MASATADVLFLKSLRRRLLVLSNITPLGLQLRKCCRCKFNALLFTLFFRRSFVISKCMSVLFIVIQTTVFPLDSTSSYSSWKEYIAQKTPKYSLKGFHKFLI